ncbi:cobalt ABC transporter permease [Methanocella sp. CWC-04]|uniref:Cobalt ABC transporter permease n=1 Tax=Methanooceanicella nereidis TaxID=2052831 RepID=A0AAP2RAS0_9EURY|nr:hypothetical protein [Methanocella sp. CWC-04]MCD1293451.1 cobalt ABC transporter permease [Methanocella sp. CWC-04]
MRKTYFSLYELTILSLLGALVFILRVYLRVPMHIPGKSGLFWVIPIILGVAIVSRPGSGTYIGFISGVLAAFLGMGDSGIFDFFKYLTMGITIDVLGQVFKGHLTNPIVGIMLGAAGNLSKMVVNYYVDVMLGVPASFILMGIGLASVSHFIFGGLGGLIASILLNRLYRAGVIRKNEQRTPDRS